MRSRLRRVSVVVDNTAPGAPRHAHRLHDRAVGADVHLRRRGRPGRRGGLGRRSLRRVPRWDGTVADRRPVVAPATTFAGRRSAWPTDSTRTRWWPSTRPATSRWPRASSRSSWIRRRSPLRRTSRALATPTSQRPQISWIAPVAPGLHHRPLQHLPRRRDSARGLRAEHRDDVHRQLGALADNSYTYEVVAGLRHARSRASHRARPASSTTRRRRARPASVSATAALDGSVNVAWIASGDGAGSGIATLRRAALVVGSIPPATIADGDATCQVTATSCSDATALNGKLYSYAVFAVDRAGNTSAGRIVAHR